MTICLDADCTIYFVEQIRFGAKSHDPKRSLAGRWR
jgi:hypothetical protein